MSAQKNNWMIIFENGATNFLGAIADHIDSAEDAIRIAYELLEGSTGMPREKLVRVIGAVDLSYKKKLDYGFGLWGIQLGDRNGETPP